MLTSDQMVCNSLIASLQIRVWRRWKDRVKEYVYERVGDRGEGIELACRECGEQEVEALLPWPAP